MNKIMTMVLILGTAAVSIAEKTNDMASLQQSFEGRQKSILAQYGKSLDVEILKLQKKGDLDNLLVIQAEKARFTSEGTVPLTKDAKAPFLAASEAYNQELAALTRRYMKALDELIKKEVVAGRIEFAKTIKAEKDKAASLLAQAEMQTNAEAEAPVPKPGRLAASSFAVSTRTEFDHDGSPKPVKVPLKDRDGLWNLSLLKTAKANASSLIPGYPRRHEVEYLNDGWYHSSSSWIPYRMPAWAEIDLGDEYWVRKVAFGSDHSSYDRQRAASSFRILVAREYSSGSQPQHWTEVYVHKNGRPVRNTEDFEFNPVKCRYVRIDIAESVGEAVRIDEIEIYGSERSLPPKRQMVDAVRAARPAAYPVRCQDIGASEEPVRSQLQASLCGYLEKR